MAITKTSILNGAHTKIFDITAATADTSHAFAHGLGAVPLEVTFCPLLAAAFLAQWKVTGRTANTLTILKNTTSLSGNASAQVRLHVTLPHTIVR